VTKVVEMFAISVLSVTFFDYCGMPVTGRISVFLKFSEIFLRVFSSYTGTKPEPEHQRKVYSIAPLLPVDDCINATPISALSAANRKLKFAKPEVDCSDYQ